MSSPGRFLLTPMGSGGDVHPYVGIGRELRRQEQAQEQPQAQVAPEEVERFLDALEQNEESLPLQQAKRRSAGRRPPEKDW